jgi:hypothetical protein
MDIDRFACRWTTTLTPPSGGEHRFGIMATGRARLTIDDQVVGSTRASPAHTMKRIPQLLRFYGALICLLGLVCAITPAQFFPQDEPPSLWCRIAGLHLAAMGVYLSLLPVAVQPTLVRKLMGLRI